MAGLRPGCRVDAGEQYPDGTQVQLGELPHSGLRLQRRVRHIHADRVPAGTAASSSASGKLPVADEPPLQPRLDLAPRNRRPSCPAAAARAGRDARGRRAARREGCRQGTRSVSSAATSSRLVHQSGSERTGRRGPLRCGQPKPGRKCAITGQKNEDDGTQGQAHRGQFTRTRASTRTRRGRGSPSTSRCSAPATATRRTERQRWPGAVSLSTPISCRSS